MEKIKQLKKKLEMFGLDGYLIPKNDEFFSEYVDNYKDRLKFISEFSGSYGFAIILKSKNYLFVDGRYTLQAQKQCSKYFQVKTIPSNLPFKILKSNKLKIGYDPKIVTKRFLDIIFYNTKCTLVPIVKNLIDQIWFRKKDKKKFKFYKLPNNAVGQNHNAKINLITEEIKKKNADFQFITSSENIAWLLNIRGEDTKYTPTPHCYLLINKNKKIKLFCNLDKITNHLKKKFKKIEFIDINSTSTILNNLNNHKIIIDKNTCSVFFENIISKKNSVFIQNDIIESFKAIKAKKEINNMIKSHIYDGVALTKFLLWLKKNYKIKKITEISAEKKLLNFRKKNKNFKNLSFPTISGTGPNGAIIHYRASQESNLNLKRGDIYLVDSGGQYSFGTTDVTRTISLDNSNKNIKNIFTRVLKGHIAVSNFKLDKNSSGSNIDHVARKYLKQINLNYEHGTGHGVGYFLNVHEGPHSISKKNKIKLKEGMVISNEPGYYKKNKFGIRIENLIYIKKIKSKMVFENLTLVPIDKDLINISMLNSNEKKWINNYHTQVFRKLKKYMNKKEIPELLKSCSTI